MLGNSGFVGQRLERYFRQRYPSLAIVGLGSADIDLVDTRQAGALSRHFDAGTTVIMCAGIKSNFGSNLDTYVKNVAMASTVCRAVKSNPPARLIFFSSIAVYGVDVDNASIHEDTPVAPDTHYGLSKYDSEVLLTLEFSRHPESALIVLRMPTMYGPGERIVAATPSGFLTTYLSGSTVTLFGDGSERREFLYVDDVVGLVDFLAQSSFRGVLNPGTGRAVSYRDALDCISRILGHPLTIDHRDRTKPKVDKVYNIEKLRALLPTFRSTSLEQGLRRIAEFQRAPTQVHGSGR